MESAESKDNLSLLEGRNINLMELIPKILNVEQKDFKITPSQYIKEMSLTTEERYKQLVHISKWKNILNNKYPPEFQVIPHILLFQNFETRGTYSLILEIKNLGKSILPLKMYCPSSEYFSANHAGGSATRLPPGLSIEFEIKFTPIETKDYIHNIIFKSLGSTFQVPCVAIGARPMLDIPDKIVLNTAPVKIAISKFVVVRNLGNAHAVFSFITESGYFRVNPCKGVIEANESMLLEISFECSKVGHFSETLSVTLETGERLLITLDGSTENIAVRLDKTSIVHDDTFVGLKKCKAVRLTNSSSSKLKFSWKKNMLIEEDLQIIESMHEKYKEISELEILKDRKVLYHELCDSHSHALSCQRILKNELQLLEKEEFRYFHEAFAFMPPSGEVWPRSYQDILVSFEPKFCGVITSEAYLEVSGRETRLPLRLKGLSLGPKIILNVNSLDIDYIYLCSFHRYEVIVTNKGDIFGTIMYTPEPLSFGGKLEVVPTSRQLNSGESAAFILSFTSNRQGEFFERVNFTIKESHEVVPLVFKGKIISPTLHFDIRQIDFGIVPIGLATVREVTLSNLSMVPVTFSLKVLSDGNVPSLSFEQFARLHVKPPLPKYPQEFRIEPAESVVEPFSSKKVTLTLTANRSGDFLTHLVVDMWDSESGSVSCPVHFHPQIASVVVDPEVITIPFCFINFPYTRSIILRNLSKIAGYFYIVPCDPNEESAMTCSANLAQGLIEPRATIKIDITVLTNALGRQVVSLNLLIFGYDGPKEVCTISCVGQGPVVSVNRDALHWGDLNLLEEVKKTLVLANESPIPANLTISLAKTNSPWSSYPTNITLAPEKTITVTVSLLLYDRGKFKDTLKINVYNGKLLSVPLSATGVGSSLKITPQISPSYDLGTLFSHKKYEFDILIENKGSKPYGLIWSPFPDYKTFVTLKLLNPPELVFKIEPSKLDLMPRESKKITLVVLSPTTGSVSQTFYCFASIGVPVKELHIVFQILAEFAEPLITFDKTEIKYWYNIGSSGTDREHLEDNVKITNLSVLPINVAVSVQYPFYVETGTERAQSVQMVLNGNQSKIPTIKFLAELNEFKYSRMFRENLTISFKENFKKFVVPLRGEVNYPNIVILPQQINFGYVPLGVYAYQEICLVNISPFSVNFFISWNSQTSRAVQRKMSKGFPVTQSKIYDYNEVNTFKETEQKIEKELNTTLFSNSEKSDGESEVKTVKQSAASKLRTRMQDIVISKSDIKAALFPLTRNYYNCDEELMEAYRLAHSPAIEDEELTPEYAKVCDIIPFYGRLEEYASQILTVRFRANYPVKVHVEAMVNVMSGPTEVILIDGYVNEISFHLNKTEFDFGKQLFCESKSKTLKIHSTCASPLPYGIVSTNPRCEFKNEYPTAGRIVNVTPQEGEVKPFSEASLSIVCNPGVPGEFEDQFYLQIAYLEPLIVKIKGFAIFPQIFLSIPRPGILNIPPESGYIAVASLSSDWFLSKFNSAEAHSYSLIKPYTSLESNVDNLGGNEESIEKTWEFINNEILPSATDINLAIERIMALHLISKDPLETSFAVYARTIPSFFVPAYELDFGLAIIGRNTEKTVTMTNRGPLPAVVYLILDSTAEEGIHIRLKTRTELKSGACLPFVVNFFPKLKKYNKKLEKISSRFFMEVYHGPKIPIDVFATVTYPHLIPSIYSLKYYEVICGCCKVITIKLKNPGVVPAVWSMVFKPKNGVHLKNKDGTKYDPSVFYFPIHSGSLDPEEYCSIPIYFQPDYGGLFSATVAIQVEESLEELKINLTGEGKEPKLLISQKSLIFEPTVPYPSKAELFFTVQNPCDFPVELYFPTFDEQIYEEEKIIRAICSYYQKKELLLPVRQPGDVLPGELVNFYQMLLSQLNDKFMEEERRKTELSEENLAMINSVMSIEDDFNLSTSQVSVGDKKKKKTRKSFSRSRTSMESSRMRSESANENAKEASAHSIFTKKTSLEIEEMLYEYIKTLKPVTTYGPLETAFRKSTIQESKPQEGTLFIFHGAPHTNSEQLANRAALISNIQVLSIDQIVLEEAVLGRVNAGITARELIEQAYNDYVEVKQKKDFPNILWDDGEENTEDLDKKLETLQLKFKALIALREGLMLSKGHKAVISSARSEGSKKTEKASTPNVKHMNLNAPIANITEDLVAEILKFRVPLEISHGVVIEGLRSHFILSPIKALLLLLKAAVFAKDILVVALLNNYEDYNRHKMNLLAEREMEKNRAREKILNILEEEPDEVFETLNLNDEDSKKIRSLFIAKRHEANVLFEKKKKEFYKIIKLSAKANKKGDLVASLPLETKAEPEKPTKSKKNKDKKEGMNPGKISERATGRTVSEGKAKRNSADREFFVFELELAEMKEIIENWHQRLGAVVVDSVPDVKTKKGHTPRKSDTSAEFQYNGKPKEDKGIYLWLVNFSRPVPPFFEQICRYMKQVVQNQLKYNNTDNWALNPAKSATFSVTIYPPVRTRHPVLDVFTLSPRETPLLPEDAYGESTDYFPSNPSMSAKLNRSASQISFKIKRKACALSKRQKSESRMSDSKYVRDKKQSTAASASVPPIKSRWVLQPGEVLTCRIRYFPMETGISEQTYPIQLVNWLNQDEVYCLGTCDIPSLDMTPEVIFPRVETTLPLANSFTPSFFYSENAYDFGSIITGRTLDEKKTTKKSTLFTFSNNSTLQVDLDALLCQDILSCDITTSFHFQVEPQKICLRPGEKQYVSVCANPFKTGHVSDVLMLFVKDNPQINCIQMKCEGVKSNVVIEPRVVNFNRLLLKRKDFRRVAFTNTNSMPVFIKISNIDNLPEQFSFSRTSCWVGPETCLIIDVTYVAKEVQLISELPVLIQVFDNLPAQDPVQEITIYLSVEAYDAALNVSFSTPDEDHLDFGEIPVEKRYSQAFNLKNVGKYPLCYVINMNQKIWNEENCDFTISPNEGKLLPDKSFPLTAIFTAKNEVTWNRVSLFKILLLEPYSSDELIAKIPIQVSVKSFFARYEILPEHFNFDYVRVGSILTGSIEISNKGLFPLTYSVLPNAPKTSIMQQTPPTKENEKSVPATSSSRGEKKPEKVKKLLDTVITIGAFVISPSTGVTEPGQASSIKITFSPTEVKNYKERIVILVNESPPEFKQGINLTISGNACLPIINFEDYKSIFREHFISKTEEEFNSPAKFGTHTLLIQKDSTLSFKNVCVGKTQEARIHLPNSGLIECQMTAFIGPAAGERQGRDSTARYFDVSPTKLLVEPYNFGTLLVTFRPQAIEHYKARLTITLDMPESLENIIQTYEVIGNGILPQIEIKEPNFKLPNGQALVSLPSTTPGRHSTASISFSNVGIIDCKVILELCKGKQGIFTIIPKTETEKMLKVWELAKPIDHTAIVSLSPEQTAEFHVNFHPEELKSYSAQIKLFIVDNPFENLKFKLVGEVFFEEVLIEKIRTALPFSVEDGDDFKSPIYTAPGQYTLNFGDCYVKKKSKALLRLVNKTEKDYFVFEWNELPNITVSPSVGHLYPNSYKEVLLVFLPEEPIQVEEATLICTLNKILLQRPPQTAWDSRLNEYQIEPKPEGAADFGALEKKEKAHHMACAEPEFEVIPETTKMLVVSISGTADYTRLTCETTKITFKNTFMFQTCTYPLVLENSGKVALEYKLLLKSVTAGPLKANKKMQVTEDFFLKISRPRSSFPSTSYESNLPEPHTVCPKRPRPLTSVSLVDLKLKLTESVDQVEWKSVYEEPTVAAHNPFFIENLSGLILPNEKVSCNIIFSPLGINEYKGVIAIQATNLHPECVLPKIEVTASSIMPYCHFNIPQSDYLESGRRDYSRPGPIGYYPGLPLDPDTKAVEIKVVGMGQTVPIEFHVINPTDEDYTFSWINTTQVQPGVVPSFHCSTMDGRIQAGRQQLMVFSFVSQRIGVTESFWKFCIPKYGVETPFLFVSDVREPSVYFLSNHINLKPTIIGSSSFEDLTLVNQEDIPFNFLFLPDSLYSEGRLNALKVEPLAGKISPRSELSIRVTFTGKTGGKFFFYLKCKMKHLKDVIVIPVETTTYDVQPLVTFEDLKKVSHHADARRVSVLDFGSLMSPHFPETITFTLASLSKTSFYYEWNYEKRILESHHCTLKFSSKTGHVPSFSRAKCDLTLVFHRKSSLKNFPFTLKIHQGPHYKFVLHGSASTPFCEFSFTSYHFGNCFLQQKDICFYEVPLTIKNRDVVDLMLECYISESSAFSFSLTQAIIPPGKEIHALVKFHPKETILYADFLKFIINGFHEKLVDVKGRGVDFKVILSNPDHTTISLGAVRIGKTSTRKFSLINKSLAPATLLVGFSDQLPVDGSHLAYPEKNPIDLSINHRLSKLITITPSTAFTIKPQEVFTLSVVYAPLSRSPTFSETVSLQFQEEAEPLCILTGCCLGPNIFLDRTFMNFGAVVDSCSSTLKLKIVNSGSIGARFEWSIECSDNEFVISPVSGYCSPESDVTIKVTFQPTSVMNGIKRKAKCTLTLPDDETYPPLHLSMGGDCVTLPHPLEEVTFECVVRKMDAKTIEIKNQSGKEWRLTPIISGDFFKGYEILIVPPLSSAQYEIKYCPLTMTEPEKFHKGSVFFRLPKGQGLLYSLRGVSLPPNAEDVITREVPCKTKYTELLKVWNWLQYPQRLKVKIVCVSNENPEDPVWTCRGFENLEVPAMMQKEYSLNFFAYKTGVLEFHVSFINEETKEFVWFNITFKIVMCGPLEVITLRSGVRQTSHHELKLENPLRDPVKYTIETTSPEVHFESLVHEVPSNQTVGAKFSFTPIHAREQIAKLNAKCEELGVFPRELRLISTEVHPDPPVIFETSLGSLLTQTIKLKNLSHLKAMFFCRVDSEDFIVGEKVQVAAGGNTQITVAYEPSEIGSTSATLFVNSAEAGNFVFPLLGMCVKPPAKGPYVIEPDSEFVIPFKNVFKKAQDFQMYVDNSAFILNSTEESILPKEECNIVVRMQSLSELEKSRKIREPRFPLTGQLVVECFNPYVKWQFYLKGVLDRAQHK